MGIETELKLRIAPAAAATLARHPALRAIKRGRTRTARVTSTYFDTADGALAREGVALRLRRDGRRWLQTVKGSADAAAGGLSTRPEYEWPVPGAVLDPLRFAATPFRRQLARAERAGLVPRFTSDIRRTTIPLAFPDRTTAHLCIDVGEIRTADGGPPRSVAVHEIEIELEAGDPQRLFDLAQALAADVPLSLETDTKAARGYALRAPRHAAPLRADEPGLPPDVRASDAFACLLRSCLAQVEGNAHGLVVDDDPEWVHQMRIGVRRLRACLSLARRGVAPASIEPLRSEMRWLAQALGPVRDLDVFARETLPQFRAAAARGASNADLARAMTSLATRAGARRREARAAARAAVQSPRFIRAVLATAALAVALESPDTHGERKAALARSARAFARPLLRKRHEALHALGTDIAHAAPEARHAARLAAKKLRYATEFFAPLHSRKRARRYRKALTVLQEELGVWNDAAVAADVAASLAGPGSPAAAAFTGWAAARGATRTEALAQAWTDFAAARPFWS